MRGNRLSLEASDAANCAQILLSWTLIPEAPMLDGQDQASPVYRPRQIGGVSRDGRKQDQSRQMHFFVTPHAWAGPVWCGKACRQARIVTRRGQAQVLPGLHAVGTRAIDDESPGHVARFSLSGLGTRRVRDRHGAVHCECPLFTRDLGHFNCIPNGWRRAPALKPPCQ
jgi:hypothetical protein